MAVDRGKELEGKFEEALDLLRDYNVGYTRLYDVTMGYKGIKNPCDFIVYKKPTEFYVECKSSNENTVNFSRLTQYEDLLERSEIDGIRAGFFIWYVEHKETYWVDVKYVKKLKENNYKSINIKDLRNQNFPNDFIFKIDGVTKRIFTDYDLKSFFDFYTQN